MTRFALLYSIAVVAFLAFSTEASSFRNATKPSTSRALQDNSDTGLLNQLIAALLPVINNAIEQFVPDPLELNLAGTINAGSLTIGDCSFSADFDYNWGNIVGLSSIVIDTLEVIPGTESISAGCIDSVWAGTFNMAISSLSTFELNDLGARWTANICGATATPGVGGDIITSNPALAGSVELAGDLCAGLLSVNFAKILETLSIGYSSVEANVDNIPPFIGSIINTVTSELSTLFQGELISQVEPVVRPALEVVLAEASLFAPVQFIPINGGFVRNDLARRVQNVANVTAQFLGLGDDGDGSD